VLFYVVCTFFKQETNWMLFFLWKTYLVNSIERKWRFLISLHQYSRPWGRRWDYIICLKFYGQGILVMIFPKTRARFVIMPCLLCKNSVKNLCYYTNYYVILQ
jgi:hypothetical protein